MSDLWGSKTEALLRETTQGGMPAMTNSFHSVALGAALILLGAAFVTEAPAASRISCARAVNSACGGVEP
jgi:hypothetical protein